MGENSANLEPAGECLALLSSFLFQILSFLVSGISYFPVCQELPFVLRSPDEALLQGGY